ncbi:hypothetical protein [Bradyrhizobium acaciae]|uniref:hypothetical protein n=1 Tax=Bradyrhizobium acaciae TaxID=2683706 RepID=UPI001E5DB48F|nr:hypothetical protein [Bradyrhizobium acaciae]MCC8978124.1 hypothetical protein [Bradyrhizobium acaciae]
MAKSDAEFDGSEIHISALCIEAVLLFRAICRTIFLCWACLLASPPNPVAAAHEHFSAVSSRTPRAATWNERSLCYALQLARLLGLGYLLAASRRPA